MKTKIKCPNCQGNQVNSAKRTAQVILGTTMAIAGVIFLFFAFTYAVGYYLFALPLMTAGSIHAYKEYCYGNGHMHCKECHTEFEYYSEHKSELQ